MFLIFAIEKESNYKLTGFNPLIQVYVFNAVKLVYDLTIVKKVLIP